MMKKTTIMAIYSSLISSLWFLVCGSLLSVSAVTCPLDWAACEGSDTCIRLYTDTQTWSAAREGCQSEGGDLVKILNSEMNQFIADEIESMGGHLYWIGLHDDGAGGDFMWLDDPAKVEYTNWMQSEPYFSYYYSTTRENCVVTAALQEEEYLTLWAVYACDFEYYHVCELDPSTIELTTTISSTRIVTSATSTDQRIDSTVSQDPTIKSPTSKPGDGTTDSNNDTPDTDTASGAATEGLSLAAIIAIVVGCVALLPLVYLGWRFYSRGHQTDTTNRDSAFVNPVFTQTRSWEP